MAKRTITPYDSFKVIQIQSKDINRDTEFFLATAVAKFRDHFDDCNIYDIEMIEEDAREDQHSEIILADLELIKTAMKKKQADYFRF